MQRILLTVCAIFALYTGVAQATTMCAADDWVVVALDPTVSGTGNSYNNALFEWSTTFDYGTVWGIATCMDVAGNTNTPVSDLRDTDGVAATGGERKETNCWCKMTHPASSAWLFRRAYASVADCGADCAGDCGFVRYVANFRVLLFGSILE